MTTDIRALSDVDHALDITIPADEFQSALTKELKKERATMNLKGFRPGRVPMSVVRKMVGPQISIRVAESLIGEAYQKALEEGEEDLDVMGQPRMTDLEMDVNDETADLSATVQFGVQPDFELADPDGKEVTRFVRTFTEEDIDADIQRRRDLDAELEDDDGEDAVLAEDKVAIADVTPIDEAGEPTGPVQTNAEIPLWNSALRAELREKLFGLSVGDTVTVELPHVHEPASDGEAEEGEDPAHEDGEHEEHDHVDRYSVVIKTVKARVLPEIDDAFIEKHSNGEAATEEELREVVKKELEDSWEQQSRQALERKMIDEFIDAHSFPVPESLVEATLDAMLEDTAKQQGWEEIPEDFDTEAFRESNREQAEQEVLWYIIKERLIEEDGLEPDQEDFEAEFEKMAGDGNDSEMIRQYFVQQPEMLEKLSDILMNRRVFNALSDRFSIVEKSREDLEG